MMTSDEIRKKFLDFFHSRKHEIVPSAPIVVKNDPTLMFTNAGMNQFKDYFLGNKLPAFSRVVDTQKCLRVSGKHNDLEEVGVDTYHHTMFEMLGNWSFGNRAKPADGYFKKEAIAWSWELLTEVYKIDKNRLYVTVFEGDKKDGLPADEEAMEEWKKWIAADRILSGNKKDNFWEMGDSGPCGPCTEIHIDGRPDEERQAVNGKNLVNNDHPQVIEIWNNVFIEYNRLKNGSLEALPAKHVDTGMGLERLVRVLQQKNSNYDTDIFSGTIEVTERITHIKYDGSNDKAAVAFRVIADHIRAIAFTIADGQLPSNTGAGYVIRRILRRAARYYYSYLNYKQPLLHQLIPVLAKQFENVFPELKKQEAFVSKVVKEEEESFLRTLDKGLKRIDDIIKFSADKSITGKSAFELYDTYGFPIDLTRLIAKENNLMVDEQEFEKEMQEQKSRSRAATAVDTEDWVVVDRDAANTTKFVGYDEMQTISKIIKYRKVKAKGKEAFQLVLDKTPFYAESGGQVGDTGDLLIGQEKILVTDTKKENDLIIHFTDSLPADTSLTVTATVNKENRKRTALHHSVTHLLHAALRNVLGTHVAQKGSLVNSDYLRFDFSHFSKTTDEEIAAVEKLVNEKIRGNIPVIINELPKEEALKLGAMALFGEKYGEVVRVVTMDKNYSVELCGGTHVKATGELGYFKILHETAVAAGVRRVEAVTGGLAEDFINNELSVLKEVKSSFKNPKDLQKSIGSLMDENAALKKQMELLKNKQLEITGKELLNKVIIIKNLSFIGEIVSATSVDALRKICIGFKQSFESYVAVLCANIDGKAAVAIAISDDVVKNKGLDAAKIIKEKISPLIKGGGGGQKNMATAGGQDVTKLKDVIETVKSLL